MNPHILTNANKAGGNGG